MAETRVERYKLRFVCVGMIGMHVVTIRGGFLWREASSVWQLTVVRIYD